MGFPEAAYTLMEIEAMLGAGVKGVKQIKRGTANFSSVSNVAITIGATVDPDKTLVLLESDISGAVTGMALGNAEYGLVYHSLVNGLTATQLTLTPCYAQVGHSSGNRVYGQCYWQLIEFY